MHDEKTVQWFKRMGVAPPSTDVHGTPEEIRANLKQARTFNWRLEGNLLTADTDFGPLAQTIPTDMILVGEEGGLPVFRKL